MEVSVNSVIRWTSDAVATGRESLILDTMLNVDRLASHSIDSKSVGWD